MTIDAFLASSFFNAILIALLFIAFTSFA